MDKPRLAENTLADVGFDLVQHAFDTGNLGFIRPPGNAAICIEGFEASLPRVLRIALMRELPSAFWVGRLTLGHRVERLIPPIVRMVWVVHSG